MDAYVGSMSQTKRLLSREPFVYLQEGALWEHDGTSWRPLYIWDMGRAATGITFGRLLRMDWSRRKHFIRMRLSRIGFYAKGVIARILGQRSQ
jgi:hypothetical protein